MHICMYNKATSVDMRYYYFISNTILIVTGGFRDLSITFEYYRLNIKGNLIINPYICTLGMLALLLVNVHLSMLLLLFWFSSNCLFIMYLVFLVTVHVGRECSVSINENILIHTILLPYKSMHFHEGFSLSVVSIIAEPQKNNWNVFIPSSFVWKRWT